MIGTRVTTPLGLGTVVYVRMAPPDYNTVEVVSVALDVRRGDPRYGGTIFKIDDVEPA